MTFYTIIIKTLSKHMIIIILQIWVKIVIFLTKCFISQNHLSFTETGVMDTGNSL